MRTLIGIVGLLVLLPVMAQAEVTIDWVRVGDPGNACDTQPQGCFGAVAYTYQIGKHEVTNAQYAEFLNALADADPNGLYNPDMAAYGGITRSGSPGSYTYSAIAGRESWPVDFVSFWDVLRFANWLHNGQPTGGQNSTTTEDGAYTITAQGIADNSITRNVGAKVFLTSEDEWYKAAYYEAASESYFVFPAGTDATTTCATPGAAANTANCDDVVGALTDVGAYSASASPAGTFDQGGNVWEWNEATINESARGVRGGASFDYGQAPNSLAAPYQVDGDPAIEDPQVGFRVASIPESVPTLSPYAHLALAAIMIAFGLAMAWALRQRTA